MQWIKDQDPAAGFQHRKQIGCIGAGGMQFGIRHLLQNMRESFTDQCMLMGHYYRNRHFV